MRQTFCDKCGSERTKNVCKPCYLNELGVKQDAVPALILKELLGTANLTSGAVPKMSGYGFAAISLESVVEKKNLLKVFQKYGFTVSDESEEK